MKGSSTPNLRTNKYLTINYINYIAYISVFKNTLFWITVWITAKFQGQRYEFPAPGLVEPFVSQIWISVWRTVTTIIHSGVSQLSQVIIKLLVAKIIIKVLFLPVKPVTAPLK